MRKDWEHPIRAVAHFEEYAQRKYNGDLNSMWATKPAHMIAKCAEALARRKAFPQDLASVYTEDEMAHADNPPMVVIQSERVEPAEPDWDALIAEHEAARDVVKLWDLRKLAQGMRPNDGPLLNRIAEAWQRTKATLASADAGTQKPNTGQMNRLFALLGEAGVKTDDARHRLAAHVLERDDVATFKDLTANDVSQLITRLEKLKSEGRLGGQPADPQTPAERPETHADTEGDQ
jgi:RecT family